MAGAVGLASTGSEERTGAAVALMGLWYWQQAADGVVVNVEGWHGWWRQH